MASMERPQRRHVSFSGVVLPAALVLVATLASVTVLAGMRFTASPARHADANHIVGSRFREEDVVYRGPHAHSLYNGRSRLDDGVASGDAESMRVRVGPSSNDKKHPRVTSMNGNAGHWTDHLRGGADAESKRRVIAVSKIALKEQQRLVHSNDFSYRDPLHEGECEPMQPWQETSFPNCNLFHELDYRAKAVSIEFAFYDNGGYNQIFWMKERDDPELVLKILHWGTAYSDRNYDRVRRDGLILERLTQSPYVLDSYGFCGFEVLTPYADGGTFHHTMAQWQRGKLELSPKTRLRYAVEAAAGLAAVHDIDGEGLSSVSHGDLKGSQYLFLDGTLKLGDFNRGRFLRRNATAPDTACTYTIGKNDAAFRSPEEYEYLPQTSAIDVWALGSILYLILTGKEVWHGTDVKKAQKYIRKGRLPTIEDKYMGDDPVDVALREAIDMCYVFDPKERAKAGEVASFLRERFSEMA